MSEDIVFKDLNDWIEHSKMPNGKRNVLKAAIKLFAERGYDGTSTAEIATESGMSQATIFKYFKTKDILLKSIIEPVIKHLLPEYGGKFINDVSDHSATLEQMIHFIIRDRFNFLVNNKSAVMILISELLINDDIKEMALEFVNEKKGQFVDVIWKGMQETGQLRDDIDLLFVLRTIASQLIFYFIQTQKLLPGTSDEKIDQNLMRIESAVIRSISK
ncbi:TetR/AcrR family transcriptional regulator [Companilactobacillus nodensis]|uniref:TetR family transcriptional regulator n=1 Tax=Companilactobacillus nodensis DSM 19682 = JCM 14932 = NBRC 107160 TaxID=1423775 RepID=A0A0R1KG62_9LACO|nr:TetR/AcrR family transcriptional regulator [Companilactobacillus nodensis]KRK80531.1 TetR family transcriptional regulator [Companilactobacillus nodensis DSM 19682 = JCM 14932 = NBRC 107160]